MHPFQFASLSRYKKILEMVVMTLRHHSRMLVAACLSVSCVLEVPTEVSITCLCDMKTRYSCGVIKLSLLSRLFLQRVPYRVWQRYFSLLCSWETKYSKQTKNNFSLYPMKSVLLFNERLSSSLLCQQTIMQTISVN